MPGCDQITIGAAYDCAAPLQGGAKSKLILINLDDLSSYTPGANNIVSALALVTNKAALIFEGYRNSLIKSDELVVPDSGQAVYRHKIEFTVFDISQAQKNNIQRMALGRVIAICENTAKNANSFEIYGLGAGLGVVAGVLRASNTNNNAFRLTLQSFEGEEEVMLPQTFFITDYATTRTAIDALTFTPTVTVNTTPILAAGGTAVTITGTNFHGGVGVSQVLSVTWVNQVTGARVNQTTFTVASNTSITCTSVAVAAGTYKCEVLTTRGVATNVQLTATS